MCDVAEFLGDDIKSNQDGTVSITQLRLIGCIITTMGLDDANTKEISAN